MPITAPSLAIANSLIKNSPDTEFITRFGSLNLNSRFVAGVESSLSVKDTSGAPLIINSSFLPNALRIDISGPIILYSIAAFTGGPESNLSTMIFISGLSLVIFLANIGRTSIIS